jgi:hypothetical protein
MDKLLDFFNSIDWMFAAILLIGGRYWGSKYFKVSKNKDINFLVFATLFGTAWILIQKAAGQIGKQNIAEIFSTYLFTTSFYQVLARKLFAWVEKQFGVTSFGSESDVDYIQYPNKAAFPVPGATNTVYYDVSTNTDWVWNFSKGIYQQTGDRPPKPPRIP